MATTEKLTLDKFTKEAHIVDDEQRIYHIFEPEDYAAMWAAYKADRPLLLRGEPGTGKSQSARAIASALDWAFVDITITGDTELSDLHYKFDAVGRLAEAQASARLEDVAKRLEPTNFLSPGVFWWAYSWDSASKQHEQCITEMGDIPHNPGDKIPPDGVVLLLDEIDKAQPDLANGLLETLGEEKKFTVPYLSSNGNVRNPIQAKTDCPLLIIITTNEERELPAAFLRRSFVRKLSMEESNAKTEIRLGDNPKAPEIDTEKRYGWLIERGYLRFKEKICLAAYVKAATMIWSARSSQLLYRPGLSEYIDLLNVIENLESEKQIDTLTSIGRYILEKGVAS